MLPMPRPEVAELLNAELSASIAQRSECVMFLRSVENNCQTENKIEADAMIQHWKSYALPSFLAAATISRDDLSALRSFEKPNRQVAESEQNALQVFVHDLGLRFFTILFLVKMAVFSVVWINLRRHLDRSALGFSIVTIAVFGILVDAILRRGQGLYPLDRLIAGSPSYNPATPIVEASLQALIDVAKGILVPTMTSGPMGNVPRGVAVFVAYVMFSAVLLTKESRFLLLIPIGLSVHFTTFGLLVLFLAPILAWLLRDNWRSVSILTFQVVLFCLPLVGYQVIGVDLVSTPIGFWGLFGVILISSLVPLGVLCCERRGSFSATLSRESLSFCSARALAVLLVWFFVLTVICMAWLARAYRSADSINFWVDGFRRESVGRLAPFIWSVMIFCVSRALVRLVMPTREAVIATGHISIKKTCLRLALASTSVLALSVVVQISNSRTFL
jgi:hypothetical protein